MNRVVRFISLRGCLVSGIAALKAWPALGRGVLILIFGCVGSLGLAAGFGSALISSLSPRYDPLLDELGTFRKLSESLCAA